VSAAHLVRRFFGSLRPGGASRTDEAWVSEILQPGELELWRRMSNPDRRHAAGVARRVERALVAEATPPVLAAALLHDVGKVAAGLGTYGRVIATLAGMAAGTSMAASWERRRGFTRKVGLYLRHAELGADMLTMAGSDPLTITWAREHHGPAERWSVPERIATALKAADDD
jgi:hypothetical protein